MTIEEMEAEASKKVKALPQSCECKGPITMSKLDIESVYGEVPKMAWVQTLAGLQYMVITEDGRFVPVEQWFDDNYS
jgi:hypothetical protein